MIQHIGVKYVYVVQTGSKANDTKVSLYIIRSSKLNNKIFIKISFLEVNTQQKLTKV